jgi:hypothetical protein
MEAPLRVGCSGKRNTYIRIASICAGRLQSRPDVANFPTRHANAFRRPTARAATVAIRFDQPRCVVAGVDAAVSAVSMAELLIRLNKNASRQSCSLFIADRWTYQHVHQESHRGVSLSRGWPPMEKPPMESPTSATVRMPLKGADCVTLAIGPAQHLRRKTLAVDEPIAVRLSVTESAETTVDSASEGVKFRASGGR